jgi:hypothetical protein
MRKFRISLLSLIVIVFTLTLTSAPASASSGRQFGATLTGAAEVNNEGVPNQGDPDGGGAAKVRVKGHEVCVAIEVERIGQPTLAHIHNAPAGKNGPVVVDFTQFIKAGESTIEGCVEAERGVARDIRRNPGDFYINIHNEEFKAGAVRGQLQQPFIRIENGKKLKVNGDERPEIVVQFGNKGSSQIDDVRVVCVWDNAIRFDQRVEFDPFLNFEVSIPGFEGLPSIFYPSRDIAIAEEVPDLEPGQNHTVAFGIRVDQAAVPYDGFAGNVQCSLLDFTFNEIATSQKLKVSVR